MKYIVEKNSIGERIYKTMYKLPIKNTIFKMNTFHKKFVDFNDILFHKGLNYVKFLFDEKTFSYLTSLLIQKTIISNMNFTVPLTIYNARKFNIKRLTNIDIYHYGFDITWYKTVTKNNIFKEFESFFLIYFPKSVTFPKCKNSLKIRFIAYDENIFSRLSMYYTLFGTNNIKDGLDFAFSSPHRKITMKDISKIKI